MEDCNYSPRWDMHAIFNYSAGEWLDQGLKIFVKPTKISTLHFVEIINTDVFGWLKYLLFTSRCLDNVSASTYPISYALQHNFCRFVLNKQNIALYLSDVETCVGRSVNIFSVYPKSEVPLLVSWWIHRVQPRTDRGHRIYSSEHHQCVQTKLN